VAVSKYYPQLAEAEETGEFCACDEALIEFFKQDSAAIEQAVNKQGMIKTSKTADSDVPPTGVEDMTFVVVLAAAAVLAAALAMRKKSAE
ncbi:MAG: hypothetical protein MSH49_03110, partial [[Eubacterium] saphenum]|nr:hypothetical protein [[Eubacterium] saphenum]